MADIKDRAREYIAKHSEYSEVFGETFVAVDTLTVMIEFAEQETKELKEQIAELSKHIVELQKDKGELIDRCRELETRCNELFLQTCGQAEKIAELEERISNQGESLRVTMLEEEKKGKRIAELEARIEEMKCCENCNNFMHRIDHRCNTKCKNLSEWEIKEK